MSNVFERILYNQFNDFMKDLKQLENYLTGLFQRMKVNNSYSSWSEIIVINIFFNNLFLYPEETFLSNYADDNTLYSIDNTIESVKKALSNDFRIIQNWFHENKSLRKPNSSF